MADPFQPFSGHQTGPVDRRVAATSQAQVGRDIALLRGKDVFFGPMGLGPDYDWPNPVLRKPSVAWSHQFHVHQVPRQLIGKDKFFGGAGQGPDYDYPNPRVAIQPWANKTHIQSVAMLLIGKDRFFGAPGQVTDFDWPNPSLRRSAVQAAQGPAFALYASIVPFGQVAWPNPHRPRTITLEQAPRAEALLSPTTSPFAQRHWPNPHTATARQYLAGRSVRAAVVSARGRGQILLGGL